MGRYYSLYPIVFDFEGSASYELSNNLRNLYKFIAKSFIKNASIKWGKVPTDQIEKLFETVFVNHEIEDNNAKLTELFYLKIGKHFNIYDDNLGHFTTINNIILIDLRAPSRPSAITQLLLEIQNILQKKKENRIKIILFFDALPTLGSNDLNIIKYFIENNKIYVCDENSNCYKGSSDKKIISSEFSKILTKSKPRAIDLVHKKLIRRLGNFKLPPNSTHFHFHRYFFDASYCIDEAIILFNEKITELGIKTNKLKYIFYYGIISPWFGILLDRLDLSLRGDKANYNNYKSKIDLSKEDDSKKKIYIKPDDKVILLVDFIHSGQTIEERYAAFIKNFNKISPQNITLLTILNNLNNNQAKNTRIINVGREKIKAHYLIGVTKEDYVPDDFVMNKLKLPDTPYNEDKYLQMTSYDFWELFVEANIKKEYFVPKYAGRKALSIMPDTISWLKNNGPYFAYKFSNYIRAEHGEFSDCIIIFPDESSISRTKHNKKHISASAILANSIKAIFNYTIIPIPRYLLEELYNGIITLHELDTRIQSIHNIRNLSTYSKEYNRSPIVILDEVFIKGRTMETIYKILEHYNKKPDYYFSIINFNPEKEKEYYKIYNNIKFLSLYEFHNSECLND